MKISIIAAASQNWVIGNKGKIPWHLPADLKYFRKKTWGHTLIMGQNTFESIGKILPGRTTIILSNNPDFKAKNCLVAHSIKKSLQIAKSLKEKEVFIAGGGSIYRQFIDFADKIYLTRVQAKFAGDTFFPKINLNIWKQKSIKHNKSDPDNKYDYDFVVYVRNKKKKPLTS